MNIIYPFSLSSGYYLAQTYYLVALQVSSKCILHIHRSDTSGFSLSQQYFWEVL